MRTIATPVRPATPLDRVTPSPRLPVHPRRAGWRAGAAASLVAFATAQLRAGRSPHHDVRALADLGAGDLPRGVAAAQELDRRLAAAVAGLVDDLRLQRVRSAVFDGPSAPSSLLDEDVADVVLGTLFDRLHVAAVAGRPHPGAWVASSVDVVPCAVHGYEADAVDCLRRSVRTHLVDVVDRADGGPSAGRTLTEQVQAADGPDTVLAVLWVGVATLAAWQAHAATL